MASNDVDTYSSILGRDKAESSRLNDQHEIMTRNAGYVIHPEILKALPHDARVADVATGTGAWTLDAAKVLLDTAQIVGFDISPAQYPSLSPANVTFTVANAKQPFPVAHHETFDLVHISALVGAMQRPTDWSLVMQNILQLLKPGGYIQWSEGDFANGINVLRGSPNYVRYTALPKLLRAFEEAVGDQVALGSRRLIDAAKSQLDNVELDRYSTERLPELRFAWTRQLTIGMIGWAVQSGAIPTQELESMKPEIERDIANGAYTPVEVIVVTAQRPGAAIVS